jgi:hypothetical protein
MRNDTGLFILQSKFVVFYFYSLYSIQPIFCLDKREILMTHLEVYKKINQLPVNLLNEVEDYVDFLLQKYQKAQFPNFDETHIKSLTLELKQPVKTISSIPKANELEEKPKDTKDDSPFLEKLLTVKISAPSDFAENIDAYLVGEKPI